MSLGSTAAWYAGFAEHETRAWSPTYTSWALGVAADDEVLRLVDALPPAKRQPNLVFAAARVCGVPAVDWAGAREVLVASWPAIVDVVSTHATQTNEPRRCATLLPVLAALPQPLALLEVGASAGLCLFPDRYAYSYDGGPVLGSSSVLLDCATTGDVPVPRELPTIAARRGIDLNPLDVTSAEDVAWLEALVWPEQQERRVRLRAACAIAAADPPTITAGDLDTALDTVLDAAVDALVASTPAGASVVVLHSAVLGYLPSDARQRFADRVSSLGVTWISNEGAAVVPGVDAPDGPVDRFLLCVDRVPVAWTGPHGQTLDWL